MLPLRVPDDYWDIARHLLARFDATVPAYERHAFVQVTIRMPDIEPHHVGAEKVRAFWRRHFAVERRLPAIIIIIHAPVVFGSWNRPHIHVVLPERELGPDGFGVAVLRLCSGTGQKKAWEAWKPYADQRDGEARHRAQ